MMKANELRIGSWYGHKGKAVKLEIEDFREANYNLLDTLEPIPLTEEWLLKFSCTKSETLSAYWHCGRITFFFDERHNRIMIEIGGSFRYYNWVHEFQNVMELVGQELAIKEL